MLQILNQRSIEYKKLAELHTDGGVDAMENILFLIEFRIKKRLAKMQGCIVHGGMI